MDFDKHQNRINEIQEKFQALPSHESKQPSLQPYDLKQLSLLAQIVNSDSVTSNQPYKEFFSLYKIDTVQHFFEMKQQQNVLFQRIHDSF